MRVYRGSWPYWNLPLRTPRRRLCVLKRASVTSQNTAGTAHVPTNKYRSFAVFLKVEYMHQRVHSVERVAHHSAVQPGGSCCAGEAIVDDARESSGGVDVPSLSQLKCTRHENGRGNCHDTLVTTWSHVTGHQLALHFVPLSPSCYL